MTQSGNTCLSKRIEAYRCIPTGPYARIFAGQMEGRANFQELVSYGSRKG
jgi:hypothetical protein